MTTTTQSRTALPVGTWQLDPAHSQVGFAVEYMVGTFRGTFSPVEGALEVAEDGSAKLHGRTEAAAIKTDPFGRERIGLTLEGAVDRTSFGLNWNNPLPTGEPALANEVSLSAELYFVKA